MTLREDCVFRHAIGEANDPQVFREPDGQYSQVQYFEPAKWVAKLRATKIDDNLIVLDTDKASGHGGKSGRFDRLRDVTREMTFLLLVRERPDHRAAP